MIREQVVAGKRDCGVLRVVEVHMSPEVVVHRSHVKDHDLVTVILDSVEHEVRTADFDLQFVLAWHLLFVVYEGCYLLGSNLGFGGHVIVNEVLKLFWELWDQLIVEEGVLGVSARRPPAPDIIISRKVSFGLAPVFGWRLFLVGEVLKQWETALYPLKTPPSLMKVRCLSKQVNIIQLLLNA